MAHQDYVVNLYAAAADAAGAETVTVTLDAGASYREVLAGVVAAVAEAGAMSGELARIIGLSTVLSGQGRVTDLDATAATPCDVLPPFAGG